MRRLQKRADGNFHENFVKSLAILAEACYNRNRKKEKKESETNQIKTKIWLQLEDIGGFCKAYRIEKGVTTNQ